MGTFLTALAAVFQFSILGVLLYIIFKYGRFRFVTKINYVYKRTFDKTTARYKKFHGFDYYYFRLEKQQAATLKYSVTVEEGSLTLEWRDRKGLLFSKTFTESETGEFSFITRLKFHSLKVDADQTRGGFAIELIRGDIQ